MRRRGKKITPEGRSEIDRELAVLLSGGEAITRQQIRSTVVAHNVGISYVDRVAGDIVSGAFEDRTGITVGCREHNNTQIFFVEGNCPNEEVEGGYGFIRR
ncbi:hypothetical protein A2714_00325 [Candidatus Woesebacteria bacterium RIFCSPHIGHO2_01_FULL_38_9]|uniref:Uncharacterized protein n=2 Tax=Candidatus Woeseibacteriota TaxID=1752722 RepID=A0A1F7Y0V3_9BACT|nr:MAG: hypothetical protein A2714_00325 [Candidatus Woesebacteria bacterium RIFCSPHIGHO2_01_FULL_38_9]OGM60192.1 MAG: hypothetical protein A3A75_05840 [Candidatus Woesebacteria bacterium RIFCSPLOWO2_01_FULL_39_10]